MAFKLVGFINCMEDTDRVLVERLKDALITLTISEYKVSLYFEKYGIDNIKLTGDKFKDEIFPIIPFERFPIDDRNSYTNEIHNLDTVTITAKIVDDNNKVIGYELFDIKGRLRVETNMQRLLCYTFTNAVKGKSSIKTVGNIVNIRKSEYNPNVLRISEGTQIKIGDYTYCYCMRPSTRGLLGQATFSSMLTGNDGIFWGVAITDNRNYTENNTTFRSELFGYPVNDATNLYAYVKTFKIKPILHRKPNLKLDHILKCAEFKVLDLTKCTNTQADDILSSLFYDSNWSYLNDTFFVMNKSSYRYILDDKLADTFSKVTFDRKELKFVKAGDQDKFISKAMMLGKSNYVIVVEDR